MVVSPSPLQCSHLPPSTLKEKNPVGTLRLKRKTVLEYLTNRIDMLEQEAEEVSKAKELLDAQDDN